MAKLRADEDADICTFKCDISTAFFLTNQFSISSVNTKTFIVMLASNAPRSFISGAKVDLSATLKQASSKEFHHIFPDKYLQRVGKEKKDIYPLANFCFLNNADNQKIKDKAPSDYVKLMNTASVAEVLATAICPSNTFYMEYEEFKSARADMLLNYANSLINP